MSIELTEMQQEALDRENSHPPRITDPRTNDSYVLLKAEEYESIREIWEEEQWRKEIHATALKNAIGRMEES